LENLDTDGEDNYKVDLNEIVEWINLGFFWINLAQSRGVWRADVKVAVSVWVL
jgi:hypothetical protein